MASPVNTSTMYTLSPCESNALKLKKKNSCSGKVAFTLQPKNKIFLHHAPPVNCKNAVIVDCFFVRKS